MISKYAVIICQDGIKSHSSAGDTLPSKRSSVSSWSPHWAQSLAANKKKNTGFACRAFFTFLEIN